MRFRITSTKVLFAVVSIAALLSIGVIVYVVLNGVGSVKTYTPFNNKKSLDPSKYEEYHLKDGEDFDFDSLYIEHPYARKQILMPDEVDELYKKKIDWSSGSITDEEYRELQDLTGHEANGRSENIVIVSTPSSEELKELKEEVVYRVTEDGTLILNQSVKEYDENDKLIKTYMFQFKLKYNVDNGMIKYS